MRCRCRAWRSVGAVVCCVRVVCVLVCVGVGVCVCGCWCVGVLVCGVLVCGCWCVGVGVWVLVWCLLWCGTLKTPLCGFKPSPCVRSKRSRVSRQHAHMHKTCGHVAGTHQNVSNAHTVTFAMHTGGRRREEGAGVVIDSSAYQNLPT